MSLSAVKYAKPRIYIEASFRLRSARSSNALEFNRTEELRQTVVDLVLLYFRPEFADALGGNTRRDCLVACC